MFSRKSPDSYAHNQNRPPRVRVSEIVHPDPVSPERFAHLVAKNMGHSNSSAFWQGALATLGGICVSIAVSVLIAVVYFAFNTQIDALPDGALKVVIAAVRDAVG